MVGVEASAAGVLQHQTLSSSGVDLRLVQELPVVGSIRAHPHPQLLRQPGNGGEIRRFGSCTKAEHDQEGPLEPVQLPEVGKDIGVGIDVTEPPAVKGEFRLPQNVEEAVLRQDRTFICLLDLEEAEKRELSRLERLLFRCPQSSLDLDVDVSVVGVHR